MEEKCQTLVLDSICVIINRACKKFHLELYICCFCRFKIALMGRNVEWLPRVHFFALTAPGSVIALAQLGHIMATNVH